MADFKITVDDADTQRVYDAFIALPDTGNSENPLGSVGTGITAYVVKVVDEYERRQAIRNLPPIVDPLITYPTTPGGG